MTGEREREKERERVTERRELYREVGREGERNDGETKLNLTPQTGRQSSFF